MHIVQDFFTYDVYISNVKHTARHYIHVMHGKHFSRKYIGCRALFLISLLSNSLDTKKVLFLVVCTFTMQI